MKTISRHVEEFLREYPFLSKFLRQGVINYRALARFMEPEISKRAGQKVGIGSIAVSLQRLHLRDKQKIHSLIGRLRGVSVISDVHAFSMPHDIAAYGLAQQLTDGSPDVQNPFCIVLRGHTETVCLIEKTLVGKFLEAAQPKVIKERDGLAALIITRELIHSTEIGGLSYPLQVLAEHGILVRYVAATQYEELMVVDIEMADRAASVLRQAMAR